LTIKFNKQELVDSAVVINLLFTNHSNDECNISEIIFKVINGSIPIPALNPTTKERIKPFLLEKNQPVYMECLFNLQPIINKNKVLGVDYSLDDTCNVGVFAQYPKDPNMIGKIINYFIVSTRQGKLINIYPGIKDSDQTNYYPRY
jgi:hypothetical protein